MACNLWGGGVNSIVCYFGSPLNEDSVEDNPVRYVGGLPSPSFAGVIGTGVLGVAFDDTLVGLPSERFTAGPSLQSYALLGTILLVPDEWSYFGTVPEALMAAMREAAVLLRPERSR